MLPSSFINPIENHREREKGVLVYPVYSRRSGGLSVGINLFPDKKSCPFNCPYCEIFPFSKAAVFSPDRMEADLREALSLAQEQNVPVKDICFSGNGEPSLSPVLGDALERVNNIRAELAAAAGIVLITNGAGLLQPQVFSLLKDAVFSYGLDIWLKLDAGSEDWYQKINRSSIPYEKLAAKLAEFTAGAPVTVQTMLCAVDGDPPHSGEARAWEQLVTTLAQNTARGGGIRKVQIYGKARPSPEDPKTSPLPTETLEARAASLRVTLEEAGVCVPVEVYV